MENYQRCFICGNYFETKEENPSSWGFCSSCQMQKYQRCPNCGAYVSMADNLETCPECHVQLCVELDN